jgi:site-specific DNA-adenine methylase
MQAAGVAAGHPSGWSPELYDPIRIASLDGKLLVFEGYHRLALASFCKVQILECRAHYGFTVEEFLALARRSNLKTRPQEPLEEAAIYAAELEGGATAESISARYDRRPTAYYHRRAALHHLCEELKVSVRDRHLKVEYGEVIGKLAKAGASRTFQIYLRDLAWKSKVRVEVFRGLGEALLSRSSGGSGSTGSLFNLAGDGAVEAAQAELKRVTGTLELRSLWNDVRVSGGKVLRRLRRLESLEPVEVKQGIELARLEIAKIDQTFGVALSSSAEEMIADALTGVGTVEVVARPLVRWEGDKTWLLPTLVPMVQRALKSGGRLIEPFAGGACLTLAVGPERGVLVDCIPEVLDLHDAARDWSGALAEELVRLVQKGEDERHYHMVRDTDWLIYNCVEIGARLVYLNKLALGGVWRVNREGRSLVPFVGRKDEDLWPVESDFEAAATALRSVECRHEHGALTIRSAEKNDVIFADPPVPGWEYGRFDPRFELDAEALAGDLKAARKRGVIVVVSTVWNKQSERLYGGWTEMKKVGRPRGIARGKEEALYAGGISFEDAAGLW